MPETKVIDLSHHNTVPTSLQSTADAGVLGIIHKCTQGTSFVDKKVGARQYLTKEAGMLWGLYHYLNPGKMIPQMDHFWEKAQMFGNEDTLLAIDFEEAGVSLEDVVSAMDYLADISERSPVLYTGHSLKDAGGALAQPALLSYRLWLAQYSSRPVLPAGYDSYWLWQFTDKGSIPGIDGNVDCNAYAETDAELSLEWSGRVIEEPEPANKLVMVTIQAPPGVEVKVKIENFE